MQAAPIFRIVGLLLIILSLTFIPPVLIEFIYQDGTANTFYISFALTLILGFLFWFSCRNQKSPLRTHDGFLIVVLFWFFASMMGALPLYFNPYPHLSFTDAFFESMSGITTTGSTIFTRLNSLPHAILYYRQQLQFIGGISIILLAVAILPTLGIGGMQLFRTEITGPVKDDKLTPRITYTAKAIWLVYVAMIALCALGYWCAGMSTFDAISHSFSTVSTGGFSTHDESLGYFHQPFIKMIAMIFMFLGAVSFNLHYLVFKRKQIRLYLQDPEFKFFIRFLVTITIIIWGALAFWGGITKSHVGILNILFEMTSFATTTGFAVTELPMPSFIPMILLFCGIIGGCAGSTSGGIKIVRVILLQKQGTREILRLIHPHGQYVIKFGTLPISPRVIEAIWGFFAIYFVIFTLLLLLLLVVETDFYSTYSALIATLSNSGRGLGSVANNFSELSDYAKWILSFAMLAGRLEIFTILVLFSPTFWRR